MAGIDSYLNSYLSPYSWNGGSTNSVFDYGKVLSNAQSESAALLNKLQGNSTSGTTSSGSLKADAANFLDEYTKSLSGLGQTASALKGENLKKTLYDKSGEITDDTVANTIKAMKGLVEEYNSNVKLLNDNADRGPGVTRQLERMVNAPYSEQSMELVGLTMNKDGTLALDEKVMTEALKTENPGNQKLFSQIISKVAEGVERDARQGLNSSARSLIQNDLANIQANSQSTYYSELLYSAKAGAYSLNNQAALGIMMNGWA